jgi:signal transduction histidine kinase
MVVIDRLASPAGLVDPDLLERVTQALGSPDELKGVLRHVCDLVLDTLRADHASVFLLDGRHLHPAVAEGEVSGLGAAFAEMGPIEVDLRRWALFTEDQVVTIDDTTHTDLVPKRWILRYSVRTIAMVALWAGGEPCGLLVADWTEPHQHTPEELDEFRTLGRYAALAVGATRPFDTVQRRARLHETMARGAAELGSLADPAAVVDKLVDVYTALLEPKSCAIALLWSGQDRLTTLASSTVALPNPLALSDVPEGFVTSVTEAWLEEPRPLELGPEPWLAQILGRADAWYLLLPLVVEDAPRGAVMLGFGEHRHLTPEEHQAAEALAAVGSVALDRHRLLAQLTRQVSRSRALYQLSAALTEGIGTARAVNMLNELLAEQGLHIVDVTLRDERLAGQLRPLGAGDDDDAQVDKSGTLAVPMRLGRRVVGTLHVLPRHRDKDERAFLDALASGLAEVLHRGALRAASEQAARERAMAAERDRLACDLHDTAGQLFVAMSLLTQRMLEDVPADSALVSQGERLVSLAAEGKSAVDDAVRGLAFLPVPQRGLVPSLRSLVRSVAADSGLDVTLEVAGRAGRMPPPIEHALFRVAHEALVNAWRHARCRTVRVDLVFAPNEAVLRVRDDGEGFDGDERPRRTGFGTNGLRHATSLVGGRLRVANARPKGVLVEARIPRGQR